VIKTENVRQRWETGQHDLTPWYQYSLSVLIYAYREFEARVEELAAAPGAKQETVRRVFETLKVGQTFSIAELERLCPTVSRATVRRVLADLRGQSAVECLGTGRGRMPGDRARGPVAQVLNALMDTLNVLKTCSSMLRWDCQIPI